MNPAEALLVVERINSELFELNSESLIEYGYYDLSIYSDGFEMNINFLGIELWSSVEDERECDEVTDEYEDLYGFLIKSMKEVVNNVGSLNF